ncbi:SAF domain-containing protein [Corynebacterium sp. MSK006]|uniref:SAF domain-containing protein n=1 Tax=Corynebacterium sp. MSK006 TaxID=3050187 RepID=UPI00254E3EDB|nr:SAF domain-containing protein [Corynebacterium sp. MSK006]MDK8895503.1 SAF domain-containing protein [Corynebacterium sp. MSK006]
MRPLPPALRALGTPGWRRAVLLRRVAAATLVLFALVAHLARGGEADVEVVVFTHRVPAGTTITEGDLELRATPPHLVPEGALTGREGLEEAAGEITVTTLGAGETATEVKLLGPAGVASFGGGPRHLVPLALADPGVAGLLRHGDEVSVLTAEEEEHGPREIARGARVVLTGGEDEEPGALLVALPPEEAAAVASAALERPLTVVLTGERAGRGGAPSPCPDDAPSAG